jgi:hypothetical protein
MNNSDVKYVPFTNIDELKFHFDTSKILIDRVNSMVEMFVQTEGEMREDLEQNVINSLHVLMDSFATVVLSIEQGYVS